MLAGAYGRRPPRSAAASFQCWLRSSIAPEGCRGISRVVRLCLKLVLLHTSRRHRGRRAVVAALPSMPQLVKSEKPRRVAGLSFFIPSWRELSRAVTRSDLRADLCKLPPTSTMSRWSAAKQGERGGKPPRPEAPQGRHGNESPLSRQGPPNFKSPYSATAERKRGKGSAGGAGGRQGKGGDPAQAAHLRRRFSSTL